MLPPSYLLHAVEPAEEIAEELHKDIIDRIVERILIRFDRGDKYLLTPIDKWQIETLQQAGYLLEDIQETLAAATGKMQNEIAEAMEDAGVRALEYDDTIYREAGLNPVPLVQSPYLIQLMQDTYEATMGEWVNFTSISKRAIHSLFVNACDGAYMQAMSGMISPAQAVREALEQVIEGGAHVEYTDKNGRVIRRDTIETATARAVRTGISQASARIQIARMDEFDVDLVIVSSHLGARPDHYVWQGKIYSRNGNDKYPDFIKSTGYGSVTGLCGANCRHHFSPWFEGQGNPFEQFDSEENQKQYELEQRQRTLERRIRNTKRETMNWRTTMEAEKDPVKKAEYEAEYQKKAALLQKQNKAYNDFCESTGLKKQHERIHIAKWDRFQAAKARAAAKKVRKQICKSRDDDDSHNDINVDLKILSTEQINKRGTKNMLEAYERRRKHFGLTTASAKEIESTPHNTFCQDYSGISSETANVFELTIDKLSKKYYTGLTRVEVGNPRDFFGSGVFASVSPKTTVDAYTLTINPIKTKDYNALTQRIKELSDKGYCVKVPDDKLGEYIGTHEFTHTLINMKVESYKNYVGMDVNFYKRAKKEIVSVYDRYIADMGRLEAQKKDIEGRFFQAQNQAELSQIQKEFASIKAELSEKKISKYSLENADEFMAECFTDCMIGEKPSVYSKEILEIIDRYWGIK